MNNNQKNIDELTIEEVKNSLFQEKNDAVRALLIATLNVLIENKNRCSKNYLNISEIRDKNQIIVLQNSEFWKNNPGLFGFFSVRENYSAKHLLLLVENILSPIEGELKVLEEY